MYRHNLTAHHDGYYHSQQKKFSGGTRTRSHRPITKNANSVSCFDPYTTVGRDDANCLDFTAGGATWNTGRGFKQSLFTRETSCFLSSSMVGPIDHSGVIVKSQSKPMLNPNAMDFVPSKPVNVPVMANTINEPSFVAQMDNYVDVEKMRRSMAELSFTVDNVLNIDQFEPVTVSPPQKFNIYEMNDEHKPFEEIFDIVDSKDSDDDTVKTVETEVDDDCRSVSQTDSDHQNSNWLRFKNQLYKTEYCRNLSEIGYCKYQTECRFAHSAEELRQNRPRQVKYKTVHCIDYENSCCYFGSRCWFIHSQLTATELDHQMAHNFVNLYFSKIIGTKYDFLECSTSSAPPSYASRRSRWIQSNPLVVV